MITVCNKLARMQWLGAKSAVPAPDTETAIRLAHGRAYAGQSPAPSG